MLENKDDNKPENIEDNIDDNKVAKRKILPQPSPVLPDAEQDDEHIIRTHGTGAGLMRPDEDDPDILAARAELRAAEERLAKVTHDKTILKAVEKDEHLDPERVEELCAAEPWKKGTLTELTKSFFGFVPEKFEMMAGLHPEGSEQHQIYMEARDKARKIYSDQLDEDVRRAAAPLNRIANQMQRRAEFEAVNAKLWRYSNFLKKDPLYQYQAARVFWAAEAGMRHHYEKGLDTAKQGPKNYTRFKAGVQDPNETQFAPPADGAKNDANDGQGITVSEKDEKALKDLITPDAPGLD